MRAVLLGLRSLCKHVSKQHVRVQCDNTTAIAYINAMGGIKSKECDNLAKQIWEWCLAQDVWLCACHIPGSQNVEADAESRVFNLSAEWSLSLPVFADITRGWGSFDIDLFASRLNYKVPCYVSWRPDPDAKFIDAFYMDWGPYLFYAFPHFSMIDSNMSPENNTRQSNRSVNSTHLDNATLVHRDTEPAHGQTAHSASIKLTVDTTPQWRSSPAATSTTSNGLQSLWQSFQHRGISNDATAIILQSWSAGIQKQYQPYIAKWHRFCAEREFNPYNPPLNIVLDFLVHLLNQDLEYTTINTARSAISAIILPQGTTTYPIISRFMKGIYRSKPPRPKYQTTWDVQPVLTYLSSLGTANNLNLKTLSLKLLMLVALVSAQRGQSLHMLDITLMKQDESSFEFLLPEHVKQSRPGYTPLQLFCMLFLLMKHCVFLIICEHT